MGACYGDGILGFIPGGIEGAEARLAFVQQFAALPGSPIDGWGFRPMRDAIAGLTEWIQLIQKGEIKDDLELTKELLEQLQLCSEQRLLFVIGY